MLLGGILGLRNNFQRHRQQGASTLQLRWHELQNLSLSLSARAIAFFIQTVFVFELSSRSLICWVFLCPRRQDLQHIDKITRQVPLTTISPR